MPSLLRTRRFLPLFVTQFLGALNDNLFKNALGVMALFASARYGNELVAAGLGVFILPYVLFSSVAGELADRTDKARLIRLTKLWEVVLMAVGTIGFLRGDIGFLMAVLFGLGVQATFFGPVKYGILPDHLAADELVAGNGLIEAGTFLGILAGTIAGGAFIRVPHGPEIVSGAGLAVAAVGVAAAWFVPPAPAAAPGLAIRWNIVRGTAALFEAARGRRDVWHSALGISWFWAIGAVVVTELPVAAKDSLGGDAGLITLLLTAFSVGVGVGSVGCARLLKDEVSARLVPPAAFGISVFCWDLAHAFAAAGPLPGPLALIGAAAGWRVLADLFLLAACGGVYSVPLYAILQSRADPAARARTIAMTNVLNAAFMVAASVVAAGLALATLSAPRILEIGAVANLAAAVAILRMLPLATLTALAARYFRRFHAVRVSGLEQWRAAGERVVVVANHVSLADGVLLAAFLPDPPAFAISAGMARKWWVKLALGGVESFVVDPHGPPVARGMIDCVRAGRRLAIFPEGRISGTGALMKVYDGAAMVADRADAAILPVRIDWLGRQRGLTCRAWFAPVRMTILPPVRLRVDAALVGRARRRALADAMARVVFEAAEAP